MSKAKQGKLHHLLSGKDDKLLWLSHQVGAPPKQAQVVSAFDFIIQFNYLTFSSIQWHYFSKQHETNKKYKDAAIFKISGASLSIFGNVLFQASKKLLKSVE